MGQHTTRFEAASDGLSLTDAILIYRADTAAFASVHKVEQQDGQPTLAAGVPLTRAHLRQWTEAIGRDVVAEILPGNVLVSHPDVLAWWIPEQVRPAFFALTTPPKGAKALHQRTILPVPYPAHLLIASRKGLGVYALPESVRPTADTPVLHSPVLNVFIDGQLCWGNVPKPKAITTATMTDYERAVFDSWSTHPNLGQNATATGKGGLVKLWDDLAARRARRFPVARLKPFNGRTLGRLVAEAGR